MAKPLYLPSPRKAVFLAIVGAAALSCGFYFRYQVIEQSSIGIACEGGLNTWLCASRRAAIALFTPQAFGLSALVAALLNLLRPALLFWAFALLAGGIGIVLYNTALSALAVTLLFLSLARPAPEPG